MKEVSNIDCTLLFVEFTASYGSRGTVKLVPAVILACPLHAVPWPGHTWMGIGELL